MVHWHGNIVHLNVGERTDYGWCADTVNINKAIDLASFVAHAQIALNTERNMYRVVASTFADKAAAVKSRNQLRAGKYPDAWLLLKK